MVIRLSCSKRIILSILLMLFMSMMISIPRIIILGVVLFSAFGVWNTERKTSIGGSLRYVSLMRSSQLQIALLAILLLLQAIILRLQPIDWADALATEAAIFIGPILMVWLIRSLHSLNIYVTAFRIFVLAFSTLYLVLLVVLGLPEGRASVFGNVSSNYCAAILYMMFPILLYSLVERKIPLKKKARRQTLWALLLSLIVILTTGSRTAMGALAVIALMFFLYATKERKARKWFFRIAAVALVGSVVMYFTMPSVQKLVQRAVSGLTAEGGVAKDVRSVLVWEMAIDVIRSRNRFLGTGSNIIPGVYAMPAHNIWLETMMTGGIYAVILWAIMFLSALIVLVLTKDRTKKYFAGTILLLYLFTGFLQPFFSTGYLCGITTWLSFYTVLLNEGL